MTTQLLEKAFAKAAKLPEPQQDALAALVIEEIEAKAQWDEAFTTSRDMLA